MRIILKAVLESYMTAVLRCAAPNERSASKYEMWAPDGGWISNRKQRWLSRVVGKADGKLSAAAALLSPQHAAVCGVLTHFQEKTLELSLLFIHYLKIWICFQFSCHVWFEMFLLTHLLAESCSVAVTNWNAWGDEILIDSDEGTTWHYCLLAPLHRGWSAVAPRRPTKPTPRAGCLFWFSLFCWR